MTSFCFEVAPEIFERFPTYVVGCVLIRGIHGDPESDTISRLLADANARSRISYHGVDLKSLHYFEVWREAFSRAGWSASRYRASVEALHRRVQRGNDVPSINPAVDVANSAVLFYSVPIGTHNIAALADQSLVVRPATEHDSFVEMNGEFNPPDAGEIVYAAGADVRTRRWVWRQSRSALVSPDATDVFFPIDGFSDRTLDGVDAARNFLERFCAEHLGATSSSGMIHADSPVFTG